jgi:AraC-like DNA-binding protein
VNPTIIRSIPVAIAEMAVSLGGDREAMVALLGDPDTERIPIDDLYALWEIAVGSTRCNSLPVRVGAGARFDKYGALGIALYVSRTNEIALRRLCRYHDLITDSGSWAMRVEGDDLVMTWSRAQGRPLGLRLANEQVLAAFATVARQVSSATQLREVRLRHQLPAGERKEHEAHFAAPIREAADEDAVVLSASFLQARPEASDPFVERFIVSQIENAIGNANSESFGATVGRLIVEALPDGVPSVNEIADRLETSERTLRRRLADEKTSFDDLLTSLQRERAQALLGGPYAIREIALAVGFTDASAFSRAFKRWTGQRRPARTPDSRTPSAAPAAYRSSCRRPRTRTSAA